MSSFLNHLFFIPSNANKKPILERLRNYMFYKDVSTNLIPKPSVIPVTTVDLPEHVREIIQNEIQQDMSGQFGSFSEPETGNVNSVAEFVIPTQQDSLFWCIYIAKHGEQEYMQISRNYGVKELEIKKQVAEYLQKNPTQIKNVNAKITKVMIQEILSELLTTQKETSLLCLYSLICYHTMNVILVDPTERFFLEFISDRSAEFPTYVLQKDSFGKYKINVQPFTPDQLTELRTKMTGLENHLKPLKSVSQYKLSELEDLARKLGIFKEDKKYKKSEIYDELTAICQWR
jgi:hypothetical protein